MGGVLSPDILSYNSVVEALGAVGRAADALALLPVLRCADLQATVATLESLLAIAFRAGMMNEVVTMWHDITRCGMRANAVSFNKFLTALISLVRFLLTPVAAIGDTYLVSLPSRDRLRYTTPGAFGDSTEPQSKVRTAVLYNNVTRATRLFCCVVALCCVCFCFLSSLVLHWNCLYS